jgi:hypothetical protein
MIKLCLYGSVAQYPENDLPALGAESFSVTMSGVSAGSFLTAQVDIIQSDLIHGAGLFSGGPYASSFLWRSF